MQPFQYLEVRPCIQPDDPELGDTISFTDEDQFREAVANAAANDTPITTFWTLYGVDQHGKARAIADDIHGKESAHATLAAFLAPFRAIIDICDDENDALNASDRLDAIRQMVDSFVDNCSTKDRI